MTALADVQNALEQRIRARISRAPNRSTVLLNLLPKRPGSGKNCAFDVTFGTATGQNFDDGVAVSTFNKDDEVLATLPWSEYGDAFKVTGRAEDASAGDGTELGQLYLKKLTQSAQRAVDKIDADLYTAAGTASPQKFHGLVAANGPLDSAGTYAGLARGTYTQWAGNKLFNGGTPRAITLDLVESGFEACYTGDGTQPDICVAGPTLWRKLATLVAPERRYVQEVTIRGQNIVLDGGYKAIEINGVPIFKDRRCPNTMFLGLNTQHIGIEALPPAQARMARGEILAMVPLAGTPQEQSGLMQTDTGLYSQLISLGKEGNSSRFQLTGHYALWCDMPKAHFWIGDLDASL